MNLILNETLQMAVMLNVLNIKQTGYIPECLLKEVQDTADLIISEGDILLYGDSSGKASEIFNKLARCIAVLSFQPGGFKGFGIEIESNW